MIGALTGYERKVEASRKPEGAGYKPLHEGSRSSHAARMRKKLVGKSTWFKKSSKNENEVEKEQPHGHLDDNNTGSRNRKFKKGKEESNCKKKSGKEQDGRQMETTNVMFVDSTPHGILCSRLQKSEDRACLVTNRRVKMVEMGGSQLSQLLSNTDPWGGAGCEREDYFTCNQGGADRKEDCFRRNLLYESRCVRCKEEQDNEMKDFDTNPNKKEEQEEI